MDYDLYIHLSTLKQNLSAKYANQNIGVLSLNCKCQPIQLLGQYNGLNNYPDLMEYWACCFLLSCEDSENPVLSSMAINDFLTSFEWALYSAVQVQENQTKTALTECIDGVLMNEILALDEKGDLYHITLLLDKMQQYEEHLANIDYTYKKVANIAFSSLWGKFKEFNEGDAPGPGVEDVAWQVSVAYKSKLETEDLGYVLADSVLEYIDNINGNNLNKREGHDLSNIKKSYELIFKLEEFVKDEETKTQIQEYKSKLNTICSYDDLASRTNPVVVHQTALSLPSDIQSLDKSQVIKDTIPKYTVPKNKIQIGIYAGTYFGQKVCIKTYTCQTGSVAELEKAYNEIKIYQRLSKLANSNNCFLKYYGSYIENTTLYMVMEWYEYNLMDYIHNLEKSKYVFQEIQYLQIIWKILDSFKQMSDQGILHNDIKPHNMLVDDQWNIKIIDFDISLVKIQDLTFSMTGVFKIQGTEGYLAPEQKAALARNENQASFNREKSDVYSLGLVFYQLLTYKNVQNLSTENMYSDIDNVPLFSNDTKIFLKKMIDPNPTTRPKFSEALTKFKTIPQTRTFTTG